MFIDYDVDRIEIDDIEITHENLLNSSLLIFGGLHRD